MYRSMTGLHPTTAGTGGPCPYKPVNRGLHLLYLGLTGKCKEQHHWRRRKRKRCTDRVLDSDGRCHKSARPGEKCAQVPARGRSSESQAQPGRGPHGVANAGEHDNKHGKRGWLQQQTQTGINNELNTDTQKSALKLMEGGPSKINPPNSHTSNPVHKAVMAVQYPQPSKKMPKRARFNLQGNL